MNPTITLTNGQQVKTVYGNWITVYAQTDNMVLDTRGQWWHVSKLMLSTAK
jgi:hypothetical protein